MSSVRVYRFSTTKAYPPAYSRLSISLSGPPIGSSSEVISHWKCESDPEAHFLSDLKYHASCTFHAGHKPEFGYRVMLDEEVYALLPSFLVAKVIN